MGSAEEGGGGDGGQVKPNFGFVKTPAGLIMCLDTLFLFIGWICFSGLHLYDEFSFYMAAGVIFWLINCILIVLFILKVHSRIAVNWPMTMLIYCCVCCAVMILASALIAHGFTYARTGTACFFGFLAGIGSAIQAFFHYKEYQT